MGGLGSGRIGHRPVVENALKLDSYKFHRGGHSLGSFEWTNTSTGKRIASISYVVDCVNMTMKLFYTITDENKLVNDSIPLTTQKTNFNGSRFLFKCPSCYARVANLYLPNGALYFRCRRCYNLTYRSCNESGKFDSLNRYIASNLGVPVEQVRNILKKK